MEPTVIKLNLGDIERSVASPALAALLRDGWTPGVSFAGEEPPGSGNAKLFLVMLPPKKTELAQIEAPPAPLLYQAAAWGVLAYVAVQIVVVPAFKLFVLLAG